MEASRRVARLRANRQAQASSHAAAAQLAAGYARVSTEEQAAHGHGLDSQERSIRAFAESQGYQLVAFVNDPGISGATKPEERPGYARLLALAAEKGFGVLLVWKFDRLARHIVYAVTAANELSERYAVVIRSVTEPIDTATPMGRTIFAVLAGMAEQERQAITERTWNGRKEKATKGGFAGGSAPYGYTRDREGGLAIVEAEAAVVRRIFALRADGKTQAQIAAALNAEGITTRNGRQWRQGQVGYMLDNPKYKGALEYLFRWSGGEAHVLQKGEHAAIV
jgi:site-specific DNA recombinase